MGHWRPDQKKRKRKAEEDSATEKEGKCLVTEAAGRDEKSDEEVSSVNLEYNLDEGADEATEDGSL